MMQTFQSDPAEQLDKKDNLSLVTISAMEMMSSETGHYHRVPLLEGTKKTIEKALCLTD